MNKAMKMNRILVMAAALAGAAMMSSCSRDNGGEEENVPVRFTAGVEEQAVATPGGGDGTRATGTEWAAGDATGVFMCDDNWNPIAENKKFTTTGDGNFTATAGDELYYPMDGSGVSFKIYYPYMSGVTAGESFDIEIATVQTTQNQPTFDMMYAVSKRLYSKTDGAVELEFHHGLTKLTIKTKAGAGVDPAALAGMTVTMKGIMTKRPYSPTAPGFTDAATDPADVTPRTVVAGEHYDAIILPGNSSGMANEKVEFTLASGETFVWNPDDFYTTLEGNEYIYTVTLARTGVTATGTITPWTTIDRGAVTAE